MMENNNRGFTLLELVLVILVSSIVLFSSTAAAMNMVKVQRTSRETASAQMDARMINTWLQNLVSDDRIGRVEVSGSNTTLREADGEDGVKGKVIVYYDAETRTIYGESSNVLLDGVSSFSPEIRTVNGKTLLTLTISVIPKGRGITAEQTYTMSAFNRVGKITAEGISDTLTVDNAKAHIEEVNAATPVVAGSSEASRRTFLATLATQLGSNGTINYDGQPIYDSNGNVITFAQWYHSTWSSDVPWCACFVSWAANIAYSNGNGVLASAPPSFANCYEGLKQFAEAGSLRGRSTVPTPGDYIFFDFNRSTEGADHVGVVLYTDGNTVVTIEGNSNNKVQLREYELTDDDIVGYGVLNWKS